MKPWIATVGLAAVTTIGVVAGSTVFAQRESTERERAAHLKLGQELPPPRLEEEKATKILVDEAIKAIEQQTTHPIERDQHPKQHGCVRARFLVAQGLSDKLRVGLFGEPRAHEAIIRFSNGQSQADNVPDVHGMAIKLLGVGGPTLLDDDANAGTQDFILVDHPVFFAIDPPDLVEFLAVRKEAQSGHLERVGGFKKQFAIAKDFFTLSVPSPLEMTYFSEAPYRLGTSSVKYSVAPAQENQSGRPALTKDSPQDALRAAMVEFLSTRRKSARFEFRVQLQTDPIKMPVEDPTVLWDSEWLTVATLVIEPQEFVRPEQLEFCENLSYTPWHSLPLHQPLGGINRARRSIYEATSKLRHEKNGVPRREPVVADLDRLFKPRASAQDR
jgi:Catalase